MGIITLFRGVLLQTLNSAKKKKVKCHNYFSPYTAETLRDKMLFQSTWLIKNWSLACSGQTLLQFNIQHCFLFHTFALWFLSSFKSLLTVPGLFQCPTVTWTGLLVAILKWCPGSLRPNKKKPTTPKPLHPVQARLGPEMFFLPGSARVRRTVQSEKQQSVPSQ